MTPCLHRPLAWMATLLVAACAVPEVQPGQPRDAVLQAWGAPSGRHALPDGTERLEYASGPWGRTTWMVDIDASGRVRAATQVLSEFNFAELQPRVPGMTPEQVLRELGRPAERRQMGWLGGELWSWRYPTNDCLWFQVSFDRNLRATGAGYNIDPSCDAPSDRE